MVNVKNNDIPKTVGVVFHELTSGFYALIMTGIDLEAFNHGYQLLISVAKPESTNHHFPYEILDRAKVNGLIILDAMLNEEMVLKQIEDGRPIVMIQNTFSQTKVSSVVPDNRGGAYMAMKHLLDLGYEDILVVAGVPAVEDSSLRMSGCIDALNERGKTIKDIGVIVGYYNGNEAVHAFRNYRERHGLPRAVFAFNDEMALALLRYFRQEKIRVPEEIAVIGFDGIDASELMGLTTVKVPMVEIGKKAVNLIVERVEHPDLKPEHIILETQLVIRETCGGAPPHPAANAETKPA